MNVSTTLHYSCRFLLTLSLLVVLAACSSQREKTNYLHVIPANATEVAMIQLNELVTKAGLSGNENSETAQKLMTLLTEGASPALASQLEALLKEPTESGIDWNAPVYLFQSPTLHKPALALKVIDLKKLESTLRNLGKEELCTPPAKANGYQTTDIPEAGIRLSFNDGTLLVLYAGSQAEVEKLSPAIAALMKQKAEQSLTAHPHYQALTQQKGDVRLLLTPDSLPFDLRGILNWPHGTQLLGYLLFEQGRIYASIQQAGFEGTTGESNQPFHPQNARELQQAFLRMMQGIPFNIELTRDELLTVTNLHVLMEFAPDEPEIKAFYQLISQVESMNLRGDSRRTNFTVVLTEKNQNALKQLVDFGKQMIGF